MFIEHAVASASSATEIRIGISPASSEDKVTVNPPATAPPAMAVPLDSSTPRFLYQGRSGNDFVRALGFDLTSFDDPRYSRSCFGTFSDPNIEEAYERERPGVNVVNGHRQLLMLHGALTVLRPILFGSKFYSELDGRYEEDFTSSILLVSSFCGFLILMNILFHMWKTELGVQVASYMIIFEATSIVAIWAYINFFIDTEFYTDMVVDSNTYVTWTACEAQAFRYFHMLRCCMQLRGGCQIRHAWLHWHG